MLGGGESRLAPGRARAEYGVSHEEPRPIFASRETLWRAATRIYSVPQACGRMEPLDGLRAYAAFLVFLVHYADSYANRVLGVDLNALRLTAVPDAHTGVIYFLFASHYGVDIFFFLIWVAAASCVRRRPKRCGEIRLFALMPITCKPRRFRTACSKS